MHACVGAFVLAFGAAAVAQEGDRRQDRGQEAALNRLKERLNLSDEQFTKIKEIVEQNREAERKLEKDREEKIKEVLTEEQRGPYDELRRNPFGGGRGERGPMGWMDRFAAPSIDQLKKELNLTDEQAEKIKGLLDDFTKKVREKFDEMRQNGFQGYTWQEETEKFREGVTDLTNKVKEHLTDEQKEKLDRLMQDRFSFGRGGRNEGRGEERGPRRPPAEERVNRAMEAIRIESPEDAAAVREAAKKAIETHYALEDFERAARGKLEELARKADATEEEIRTAIDELRKTRKEKDAAVKDARKSLSEIVSYRQELELIRHGILR